MAGSYRSAWRLLSLLVIPLLLSSASQLRAEECCDPAGPFALGEEYPREPATCETIGYWADRAPVTEARISLGIKDKITAVESDGALVYLVMCEPERVQVMCVTYSTNGLGPGDVALFGGGYSRIAEKQVLLDPCLASRD